MLKITYIFNIYYFVHALSELISQLQITVAAQSNGFNQAKVNKDSNTWQIVCTYVQCNLNLVTPYLVTNHDLVTILQKTIF